MADGRVGRPRTWERSDELRELICERLSASNCSLVKLCEASDDLPAASWVYAWLASDERFQDEYAIAREQQVDRLQFQGVEALMDLEPGEDEDPKLFNARVNLARSRADACMRLAAQVCPRKYGKQVQEHTAGGTLGELVTALDGAIRGQRRQLAEGEHPPAPRLVASGDDEER